MVLPPKQRSKWPLHIRATFLNCLKHKTERFSAQKKMKKILAFAVIAALTCSQSFAKTLSFPNKGDAMFKITIPDSWEPDADDDEVVEATSPKEHVQLSIWEIQSKEDLENLGNDIEDILKDHAKEIKLVGEPQEAHPGGLDGLLFSGTAVNEEDDHGIEFFALMIATDTQVAVVFIEADANTPKKELDKLSGILKSITPPGGKKVLRVVLALDKDSKPTRKFATTAETIHAFFIGESLKKGDEIKSVWIAEDVGDVAPKNTKIDEATVTASTPMDKGDFSLSKKPDNDWAVGTYRVEIYVNNKLVQSVKYQIADE